VGHVIPPVIQVAEVGDPLWITWRCPVEVEQETEALEVSTKIVEGRIA
jgi:hypothetical protein